MKSLLQSLFKIVMELHGSCDCTTHAQVVVQMEASDWEDVRRMERGDWSTAVVVFGEQSVMKAGI